MTIEEKQKEIEKYCDKHICHTCALRDFHLDDVCYHEENCKRIDEMYNEIINEGVVKELKKRKKEKSREYFVEDKGTMTVKGTCYEDIVTILCVNGYMTNVITHPSIGNLGDIEHTIVFWKEPVSDNSYQE